MRSISSIIPLSLSPLVLPFFPLSSSPLSSPSFLSLPLLSSSRFPANYVEELEDSSSQSDEQQLGNLQQGSIDLSGILVETHSLPGNHMYLLSIFPRVTIISATANLFNFLPPCFLAFFFFMLLILSFFQPPATFVIIYFSAYFSSLFFFDLTLSTSNPLFVNLSLLRINRACTILCTVC